MGDINTIQLRVLVPLCVKSTQSFRKLINDLSQFETSATDEYDDINSISIMFTITGIENVDVIEELMDAYVNEHTKIRYSMLIFWTHLDRKYPSSVRINKKGKKS